MIRGRTANERRTVRQEKSPTDYRRTHLQLHAKLVLINQRTQLAGTIRYALSRWQRLTRLIGNSRILPTSSGIVNGHPNSQIDDLLVLDLILLRNKISNMA
ncbi:hypothetical protein J2S34_003773 [Nitrobacter winogradskyi]|uniref:Uncharacterized protein n=1 Tax=Nitrobacter winogradskyi TaxID=913 RepID=A0ACC6AN62_NITWI|nr:hypothetical protein [Nitrobacter winogradskyi]